jgi:integrase
MQRRRGYPPGVSAFYDRHGKLRLRGRKKGRSPHYFKAPLGTPEFEAEHQAWWNGAPIHQPMASRSAARSLSDVIERYYRSTTWASLAESSQKARRNVLERFRGQHGDRLISEKAFRREHVKAIIEAKNSTPEAGKFLLKMIRALMKVAIEDGLRETDPTFGIKPVHRKSDGHHTWTNDEIEQFRDKFPTDTQPRLAFELLLNTGQRLSDVARMGRQHIKDGRVEVRQGKTKTTLAIPIHPDLHAVLRSCKRDNMTFVITAYGKPRTSKGFGNWFAECIEKAGLPTRCVTHGLRKASARRLAEVGCTVHEIAAITGHKDLREIERYTKAVEQRKMADMAMAKVIRTDHEQKLANLNPRLAIDDQKSS